MSALEGVAALVDKSLLRQAAGDDSEPRFVMLETVREFALEQLAASGEDAATGAAHADVVIALAEAAQPHLTGPGQREWLPRLEREHDDVRAAFDWSIRTGDVARALRLGAAMVRFWIIRGFHTEGRRRLRAALALPYDKADEAMRARVLSGIAILAYEQASLEEANAYLRDVLDYYRRAGDERGLGETLNHLGWAVFFSGDVDRAEALTQEAIALHEKNGDVRGLGLSLTNLGAVAGHRGQLERARGLYERALELRRTQNDPRSISYGALNLATTLVRLGRLDHAEKLTKDAEQTLRALGDKQILAYALYVRGMIALERSVVQAAVAPLEESVALGREVMQGASLALALGLLAESLAFAGDLERAMECADEAVALHEQGGTHVWLIDSLRCRGSVLRIAGQPDGARETFGRALRIAVAHDLQLYAADCLANLAAIASENGRHVEGMRLVGAARASRSHAGAPASHRNPDLDAIEALARSSIGADAVARAQDEGASTSLPQFERLIA
jgi:tetratricopeptide (TPR) repeat protein